MADEWIEAMLPGGTTDPAKLRSRAALNPISEVTADAKEDRAWCEECVHLKKRPIYTLATDAMVSAVATVSRCTWRGIHGVISDFFEESRLR